MKLTSRKPTPDMVEAERVKFEAWCAAKDINASYWLGDKRNGYNNGRVSDYWFGWKERAMHDAAPTVEAQPVAWMDDFGNAFPLAANKGAGSWLDEHKRNWKPLYTHPAAPQPAALPEPDYKAGEKGMLGEDCYSAATVRAYGEACARAALKGKQ